jgi:hypothetical protein
MRDVPALLDIMTSGHIDIVLGKVGAILRGDKMTRSNSSLKSKLNDGAAGRNVISVPRAAAEYGAYNFP